MSVSVHSQSAAGKTLVISGHPDEVARFLLTLPPSSDLRHTGCAGPLAEAVVWVPRKN